MESWKTVTQTVEAQLMRFQRDEDCQELGRGHSWDILAKNLASFFPGPETLREVGLKENGQV